MAFYSIETRNYRNLKDGAVNTGAAFVFFVGENAQGKTNMLDALYGLCYGNSFREKNDKNLARLGEKDWTLSGKTLEILDKKNASASLEDAYEVQWKNGLKTIRENGKPVHDRKFLVEKNPAIVFCHDDIEFAYGEPERRRFFFDQTASLVSPSYIDSFRNYKKIIKMRNSALKNRDSRLLDVLDIQLISYGLVLQEYRASLVSSFNATFSGRFEKVSRLGEEISVEYKPSWGDGRTENLQEFLAASREREFALGMSSSGPHRDKYLFTDKDGDFSGRASTGQRRLLALTLRIAQAEFYTASRKRLPVLLLDDVLLELDQEKRKRFMGNLPENSQAFFTFLPDEPYRDYLSEDTLVYWTKDGQFTDTKSF